MMKISSFILIVILLHAITFVASAEEDGGVNLVKRARTKEKHKKQLVDHWFPNHTGDNPQQNADDGSGDDSHLQTSPTAAQAGTSRRPQRLQRKTVTKGSSAKTKSSMEHSLHSSSSDWDSEGPPSAHPSSEEYEEWKPGDALSTDSSSAHSEDWNSQETSSSSQSSDWDPKQARRHASSTARTRSLLSKAKAKPKALNLKAGSLLKAAANDARRHRASESSAHVHTSSDEKSTIAVRPSSSSQEPLPLARPKMTYSMPRLKNPESRAESEKAREEYEQSVADGTPEEEARATYAQTLFSICKKVRETLPYKSHIPCFKLLTSEKETMRDDKYHAIFKKEAKRYHQNFYRESREVERKKYHRDRFGPTAKEILQGMVFTPEQTRNKEELNYIKRLNQRIVKLLKQEDHPRNSGRSPAPWSEKEDREVTDIIAKDPGRFRALERNYRLFQVKLSRQDKTSTHGSGQPAHHEESEEYSHNLIDHSGQTKNKNRKDFPLSSLGQHDEEKDILTTPSPQQFSQSDDTWGANLDIPWGHEQALPSDTSDDEGLDVDQRQAPSLTSDLLKLLREEDPAVPRRLRSGRKGPQRESEDEGAASSEESIDIITESTNVRPAARRNAEVRGKTNLLQEKLVKLTKNVVNDFKKTRDQDLSAHDQKKLLTEKIFQALRDFRQGRLKKDPSQAKKKFFALKGLDKNLIDERMFQRLKRQHQKEEWQGKLSDPTKYNREYYSGRFGPSNEKLAKGYTGTLEQKRERDDDRAIRNLKSRLKRWIPDGTGRNQIRKPWTKTDTNNVFRLVRDYPSRTSLLETFEKARPNLPPETWQETTSVESLLRGGGEEARIEGNSRKDKMMPTPRRHKKMRST